MQKRVVPFVFCFGVLAFQMNAASISITFTPLSGLTGGSPAETAVYRADLSTTGLASILSIAIADNSFGLGGASGQFSGFDLDAVKLSTTLCTTASCAASLPGMAVFNFSAAGTVFAPGAQRAPADPKLFGTDATGSNVDNAVATLGLFDGKSTTAIPGAFGFVSLGDGGSLAFNLTSAVSPSSLYLYIGEVGDNGEVAAGRVTVSDVPATGAPEPASFLLIGSALVLARIFAPATRQTLRRFRQGGTK